MAKQYQLPREFAEKWIAALRSGEYKQTIGTLGNSEKGFCCLGVAGILCGAKEDMYVYDAGVASFLINEDNMMFGNTSIPKDIFDSMPELIKGVGTIGFTKQVSDMNDSGKSFPEIADWIEQNVEFV